eukprot:6180956-Pleurochrysis_carterae.AAC.1
MQYLRERNALTSIGVRAATRRAAGCVQTQAAGRASMPAKSGARAALCCAGAQPAACGIAELEDGNPINLV